MNEDYVRTARAKGVHEKTVKYKHILRNCLSATITIAGLSVVALIGNGVLIENIFARPGIGKLFVTAVLGSDYTVVQSVILVYTGIVILVNFAVELSYAFVDPRIRYD